MFIFGFFSVYNYYFNGIIVDIGVVEVGSGEVDWIEFRLFIGMNGIGDIGGIFIFEILVLVSDGVVG